MRRLLPAALLVSLLAIQARASDPQWIAGRSDSSRLDLPVLSSSLPSPDRFLGYSLGERFTHHEAIVRYLYALAESSERVAVWEYGRTYEGRPLVLAAVSSAENIERLDEIRARQLQLANATLPAAQTEEAAASTPVFVWLAYGIHGNESSSPEAAIAAAFTLATGEADWEEKLGQAIILIDPLANPDGHERYVHFFETHSGRRPDPYPDSAEHREPWPGGRQNHYLIDLNRDWTWATQQETRARLLEYRRWEPHVYVDFHEMSARSTYFFPPSAEPIHPVIDRKTVRWLEVFGRANATRFDQLGWVYYVGENFDLFYPGYSDSYPSLRGAIGMTYEVAGHGRAGLAIERPDGSLLTLADRIVRHLTTSLTTVRTAIANRREIVHDFLASRKGAATQDVQTYLWRADQGEALAAAMLLAEHGLAPMQLAEPRTLEVRPMGTDDRSLVSFPAGTYLLSTAQPLAPLARSLMELDAPMSGTFLTKQRQRLEENLSTEFFDITAWSVPLAFNLEVFAAAGDVRGSSVPSHPSSAIRGSGSLGFLIRPQGLSGYRLTSALLGEGVKMRLALAAFEQGDTLFPRGTIFVPALGNPEDIDQRLVDFGAGEGIEIWRASTGLAGVGISLGSDAMVPIRLPRIGLLGGRGVRPTSFGFLWHLLDRDLDVPYRRLDVESLDRLDLSDFDVLVVPGGDGYSATLGDDISADVGRWIEGGGVLIAVGDAVEWLQQHSLTTVESWQAPEEEDLSGNQVTELTPERRNLYTPGAALKTGTSSTHPLTVGLERPPSVLFRGSGILLPTGDPRRDIIVTDREQPLASGFAWPEAEDRLKRALLSGIERHGRGAVVLFSQDPVFRLFWRASAPPFLNALLYAPSLNDHGRLFE